MIEVPLSRGLFAIVDDDDSWVLGRAWFAHPRDQADCGFYAKSGTDYLHRVLLDAKTGEIVDHRNGNGLDCRRSNLRVCNDSLNNANREYPTTLTGFRGVYLDRSHKRSPFKVEVGGKGNRVRGGRFQTAEAAARKYDELALAMFGEFAVLNFPAGV